MKKFVLLGERCSGTNLVADLLKQAASLEPSYPFGFKHFPQGYSDSLLGRAGGRGVILVVRHPESWLRSFFSKPWHVSPSIKALDFSGFLRAEWSSIYNEEANVMPSDSNYNTEILADRNWSTNERFANVIQMRSNKLRNCLQFISVLPLATIVRLEDLQGDPDREVERILAAIDMPASTFKLKLSGYKGRKSYIRQIAKFLGVARLLPPPESRRCCPGFTEEDRAFLWSELDVSVESSLGYEQNDVVRPRNSLDNFYG